MADDRIIPQHGVSCLETIKQEDKTQGHHREPDDEDEQTGEDIDRMHRMIG